MGFEVCMFRAIFLARLIHQKICSNVRTIIFDHFIFAFKGYIVIESIVTEREIGLIALTYNIIYQLLDAK